MLANFAHEMKPHLSPWRPADRLLWLAAGLPTAILALLFLALLWAAPAHAAGETVCTGRNLLPDLEREQPDRYAAMLTEAETTPNGKSRFWKIEKPGLAPSWLLGTMHVTDPRVLTLSDAARKASSEADVIVIESDEILDEKKAAAALMMQPELTMFTDGTTISDRLTPEEKLKLEAGLKERGIPLSAVNRMKPWIIASVVAMPACEMARKATGASFLDKKLAEDAKATGQRVAGLETLAEQIGAMADLPLDFHLKALIETLALNDEMDDIIETMTELYLAGDIGMTMPMLEAVTPEASGEQDAGYAAFEKRIVLDRNKVMAERSAPLLANGNAFIAVGALHLPGEEGLVQLLRKQGFSVSAVD